jgi:hypothetical protein
MRLGRFVQSKLVEFFVFHFDIVHSFELRYSSPASLLHVVIYSLILILVP